MGFGIVFGAGPFGNPSYAMPAQVTRTLSSSRRIDGVSKRFVMTPDGDHDGMPNVSNRVYGLVCFAIGEEPHLIDDRYEQTLRMLIAQALQTLVDEDLIEVRTIEVSSAGGTTFKRVRYKDLTDGKVKSVEF